MRKLEAGLFLRLAPGNVLDGFGPLDDSLRLLEGPVRLGAVGLAIGSAVGAWVELSLLSLLVRRHVPALVDPRSTLLRPAIAAALAFVATAALKLGVDGLPLLLEAAVVIPAAVLIYLIIGFRIGVRDTHLLLSPIRRAVWRH